MTTEPPQQAAVPMATSSGPSGPRASFGRRLVAYLLDSILIGIVYGILLAIDTTLGYVASLVLSLVYYSYFEGSASGQTVGKKALGIRVIDFNSGGPIGFGRGAIRWLGRILSTIPCFLGYFWMLWDKEKQCWQDKIAGSVVVPADAYR
jgi:uncharacterized RDD family membrane protein YckC